MRTTPTIEAEIEAAVDEVTARELEDADHLLSAQIGGAARGIAWPWSPWLAAAVGPPFVAGYFLAKSADPHAEIQFVVGILLGFALAIPWVPTVAVIYFASRRKITPTPGQHVTTRARKFVQANWLSVRGQATRPDVGKIKRDLAARWHREAEFAALEREIARKR